MLLGDSQWYLYGVACLLLTYFIFPHPPHPLGVRVVSFLPIRHRDRRRARPPRRDRRRLARVRLPARGPIARRRDLERDRLDRPRRARSTCRSAISWTRVAPLYDVREDRVRALAPDVMVTQVVCDVCAVSEDDVRALATRLSPRPEVVTLGATTLDGIFDDIRRVADGVRRGRPRRGAGRALAVAHARGARTLKAARAPRPRVAVIEWTDPIFAAGHWVPEMVCRAGGIDVLQNPGNTRRRGRWTQVRDANPDVILVAPCGFDLERAAADAEVSSRTSIGRGRATHRSGRSTQIRS